MLLWDFLDLLHLEFLQILFPLILYYQMTQRSEDLLLIALPETIPSGLRAVMRPCLAGRAEDRWSAQRAANQLDGNTLFVLNPSN